MNREIKFRVRNAITKQIVGYERIKKDGHWEQQRVGRTEWLLGVITDNNLAEGLIREQFTGLHNKNGKEIYEGDVVKYVKLIVGNWVDKATETYTVEYRQTSFQFCPIEGKQYKQYTIRPHSEVEVIGNIYENPNLQT